MYVYSDKDIHYDKEKLFWTLIFKYNPDSPIFVTYCAVAVMLRVTATNAALRLFFKEALATLLSTAAGYQRSPGPILQIDRHKRAYYPTA